MNIKKTLNFIHSLPLYWALSGLFLVHNGDKILVGVVLLSLTLKLITHLTSIDKINVRLSKFNTIMLIAAIYASISYFGNGYSSSEIRVLLSTLLYLCISAPKVKEIKPHLILIILALSSLAIMYVTYSVLYIDKLGRMALPLNAIPYANFIAILGLLSIFISLLKEKVKYKAINAMTLIVILLCVVFTDTRGTWLAIIITSVPLSVFLIFNYHLNTLKTIIFILLGIACLSTIAYPHLEERYIATKSELISMQKDELDTSSGIRVQLWKVGVQIIFDTPSIVGIGPKKHLAIIKEKLTTNEAGKSLAHFDNKNFHNSYIDRTVKYGFIGLGIFLAFLGYPFYRGLKEKDPRLKIPLVTLPIFISVAALTYVPLSHPGTFFLYIFIIHYYIQASDVAKKVKTNHA